MTTQAKIKAIDDLLEKMNRLCYDLIPFNIHLSIELAQEMQRLLRHRTILRQEEEHSFEKARHDFEEDVVLERSESWTQS